MIVLSNDSIGGNASIKRKYIIWTLQQYTP